MRSASRTSTAAGTIGRCVGTFGRRASAAGLDRSQPVRFACSSTFEKVEARGAWPGVEEGVSIDRTDSMCHRLLGGAPSHTSDAASDPAYADAPVVGQLGITSYVGVPVHGPDGTVVATLCGIDRSGVEVSDEAIEVLQDRVAERYGFALRSHKHELYGVCPDCQKVKASS